MTADPEFYAEDSKAQIEELRARVDSLQATKVDLMRQRTNALAAVVDLQKRYDIVTALDGVTSSSPTWLKKVSAPKRHTGIANLLLSDLHLDEVVFPRQMAGVNAYNRKIAERRLRALVDNTIDIAKNYITGYQYEGLTLWLGGDIFSGNIHEELKQTNEAPIMASFDFWIDPLVAAIRLLADEFGKVHVPGCVGNHGRNTYKPIAKNRVEDNFDWLFYRVLARELKGDDRITWDLPVSADVTIRHYDHTYLLTHGDQFRGGSGISGIQTPLALGAFRKSKRQQGVGNPFDTMLLGHFHQYSTLPGIVVNGSLKGYDEYASISNFGFEVPQQAFWISTPERGPVFHVAIQPMNRSREGW